MRLTDTMEDTADRAPAISVFLAVIAMVPVLAGGILVWVLPLLYAAAVAHLTLIYAGAVVCFLAGVRRGLSFRQPGGTTSGQIGSMFWVFVLGLLALLSPYPVAAVVILLVGYLSLAVLDPIAARHGEAPRYFARLRPPQMLMPLAGLVSLLVWLMTRI